MSVHVSLRTLGMTLGICVAVHAADTRPAGMDTSDAFSRRVLERVRSRQPSKTPVWVNTIPDRVADILVEKHRYAEGEVWGLAKTIPDKGYPYDEVGSATYIGLVQKYNLFDRVGVLDEKTRRKALKFWQGWQDPQTGRFKDPRDPDRVVNEKYVVSTIRSLGGDPLYPWTTTGTSKRIETELFLRRTRTDPDWEQGGWGVGSHTGLMAVEIFRAINEGEISLIPDLEKGMEQILSHQDPEDGLWGPPSAGLMRRIGGTLKVVGRFYFAMGMTIPHTRELADALILHSKDGGWFKQGEDSCVPRNVAEVTAYCLEASGYRHDELLAVLDNLVDDYRLWVNPDGRLLIRRGDRESVGLQYTTVYGLGLIGAYLHWEDCRLSNPLAAQSRGFGMRYRLVCSENGHVRVVDTRTDAEE